MNSSSFCPLSRLERLLVATDRSEYSEGAVREAKSFARQCSSKVYVMSVIEPDPDVQYKSIGSRIFHDEEEALQYLFSVKSEAIHEGLACEAFLRKGSKPHKLIVEEAIQRNVDMIILGRHGRRGLMKLLVGEVPAKVIGEAPCKVLVVPKNAKGGCTTLLTCTDGSDHSMAAASEAIGIAKRCGSSLIAVSAARSQGETDLARSNVARVTEMCDSEGLPVEAVTEVGKPCEVINRIAVSRDVTLIVVGTYGSAGLRKLLMGSTTEKVIGLADCSVLVVSAKARV